jgi:CheY-like chemotaxis protein
VANEMNDVIVADDDSLLVGLLSEIFKESGYAVRTASDGFAALTSIRERVPDILMSDLNMPRMSGFELLSIVRRRFPSIAVIEMSGAYSGVAVPQGIAADAFYAKGSLRAAAPIWIHGAPIDQDGLATIAVACPECLRTFPRCLHNAEFLHTERCWPPLPPSDATGDCEATGGYGSNWSRDSSKTVRISVPAYIR